MCVHCTVQVCLLTSFARYECDSVVMAAGGLALLPQQLSFLLRVRGVSAGVVNGVNGMVCGVPAVPAARARGEWVKRCARDEWGGLRGVGGALGGRDE